MNGLNIEGLAKLGGREIIRGIFLILSLFAPGTIIIFVFYPQFFNSHPIQFILLTITLSSPFLFLGLVRALSIPEEEIDESEKKDLYITSLYLMITCLSWFYIIFTVTVFSIFLGFLDYMYSITGILLEDPVFFWLLSAMMIIFNLFKYMRVAKEK